jgi:thioredoxin
MPPPAKKEDVVFEVTASNFQKLVLESPVPVLLDVYADWCGPCKQLGPILENAAVKAGGMFRLAKVNSDQERAVAEALGVTGLPTVFTVSQGKLSDR